MKVVQINAVYEYSSTGRTTTEMHEYLLSQGIKSYVFCTNKSIPERNIFKFSNTFDKKLHALLSRIFGLQGMFSFFSTKKLVKQLKKIHPDIVHLRVLHSNCINFPILLKYLGNNNIPTVITLHDCWYFTGHCCYFIDANCQKWKNTCGNCPEIKKWNSSLFFDNSSKLLTKKKELFSNIKHLAVIGVSDWVTGFIKDSILKDAQIVRRIYNWIDLSKFTPRDSNSIRKSINLTDTDFVVLGVAQIWAPQKGLDEFIKIAQRCPEMKFVIVGNPLKSNLPNNIICVGIISNVDKLIDMYSMADVFFNPSLRETFGKVTAEAIASGTPTVAYRATATPELVKDGCGYIVEVGDIDSAINYLQIIKKNGKNYYFDNCKLFAENNFKKEILIKEYLRLYTELQERNQ